MSNRRRARRPVAPINHAGGWPEPRPGESYAFQFAVALDRHDESNVDDARSGSHDALLRQLGDRQRTGVWWTHHHSGEATNVIDSLYGDLTDPSELAIVAEIRERMKDPSALLVIAWCIGAVPPGVAL